MATRATAGLISATVFAVAACGGGGAGTPDRYVALGDSFSSGEGAAAAGQAYEPGTDTDTNACHRSASAYPVLLAEALELDEVLFVACSGATSEDILGRSQFPDQPPQLRQLRDAAADGVGFVTLTAGGNDVGRVVLGGDAGFGRIFGLCAVPFTDCVDRYEERIGDATIEVGRRVGDVAAAVVDAAGEDTPVYVLGYPRILPAPGQDDCALIATFDDRERAFVESTWRLLNETIRAAAIGAGAHFVDVHDAFDRHLVCSAEPYVHAVLFGGVGDAIGGEVIATDSFHPNPAGHACLAQTFLATHPDPAAPSSTPDGSPAIGAAPPCP